MKAVKFIIFAHPSLNCSTVKDDNFIRDILGQDYYLDEQACAIGLKNGYANQIRAFDSNYDIFLFEDTGHAPQQGSIFFRAFCNAFFEERDAYDFRIIFHKTPDWSFKTFQIAPHYEANRNALEWLRTFNEFEHYIFQTHQPSDIFGMEMILISEAIVNQQATVYERVLKQLNERFRDPELERLLKPFIKASPLFEHWTDDLQAKKEQLLNYLKLTKRGGE